MLSRLPSRALALPSLLSPSNVLQRYFTAATRNTDAAQATTDNSMDQITDILDDADLSASPRSNNFRVGPKYERTRKGRLPKDQRFLKPTDLLPREDPFRRKRALLGPGAAESRRNDWFYQLDIDPLDEAMNSELLSYFVSEMGKIKSRAETKLTWRNQRRLTKAIRRAKMMGIIPILNRQITLYKAAPLL